MNTHEPAPAGAADDIEQQALDWYVRARNGLGHSERQALQQWLRTPAHQQAYARWDTDWRGMDALAPEALAALRQGWQAPGPAPHSSRRRWLLGGTGLAACAVLAAVTAGRQWAAPLTTETLVSAPGQTRSLALPGGGRIELDTMSRLAVAHYPDRTELDLIDGQVWLDLVPGRDQPCHLLAGAARMAASGTVSVRHTPAQAGYQQTHIAVAAGHAQLWQSAAWRDWLPEDGTAPRHAVHLNAGQQAWHDGATQWRVTPVAMSEVAPWRQGRLMVYDVPLIELLGEFARYGHAVPRIADARVARLRITGTFNPHEPDTLYRLLPQILPVQIEPAPDGARITMVRGA